MSKLIKLNETFVSDDFSTVSNFSKLIKSDAVYICANQIDNYEGEIFDFRSVSNQPKIYLSSLYEEIRIASGDYSKLIPSFFFEGRFNFYGKYIFDRVYLINLFFSPSDLSGKNIKANHVFSDAPEQLKNIVAPKKTLITKKLKKIIIHKNSIDVYDSRREFKKLTNINSIMVSPYFFSYNISIELADNDTMIRSLNLFFEYPPYGFLTNLHADGSLLKLMDIYSFDDMIDIENTKIGFIFEGNWNGFEDFKLKIKATSKSKDRIDTSGIPRFINYEVKQNNI